MPEIQDVIDIAEQECTAHGVRLTNKRMQVLSGLLLSNKALSAYELIDFCKDEFGESMPAVTVYRVLDFLQQNNLVHRLDIANKYVACAHIGSNHEHTASQFLICSQCQAVKEINIKPTQLDEFKKNAEQAGFYLVHPKFEMNCICKDCKAEQT